MSWEINANTQKTVVLVRNGQRNEHQFEGTTQLKDAISQVASSSGLGSVIVRADGREIEPTDGEKSLSEFGTVEVMPKMAGASFDVPFDYDFEHSFFAVTEDGQVITDDIDTPSDSEGDSGEETQ